MRRCLPALVICLLALIPSSAIGAEPSCKAPPGTAAIDQYCESIPSAEGDRNSSEATGAPGGVDRRTARAIARSGDDGAALNRLLAAQAATTVSSQGGSSQPSGRAVAPGSKEALKTTPAAEKPARAPSENPLSAIRSAVSSGPTLGDGLIWALLGITLLAVGAAWLRFRGNSD